MNKAPLIKIDGAFSLSAHSVYISDAAAGYFIHRLLVLQAIYSVCAVHGT